MAIPWTLARQASLSMELSRQEHWSKVPCPLPGDLPNSRIAPASLKSPALASGMLYNYCHLGSSSAPQVQLGKARL